jgi:hypothetical protein
MKYFINKYIWTGVVILMITLSQIISTSAITPGPGVPTPKPDTIVPDPKCISIMLSITDDPATTLIPCNTKCHYECIQQNKGCEYMIPSRCKDLSDFLKQAVTKTESLNIFGIDFGPTEQAVPSVLRLVVLLMMGIIALLSIVYGLYSGFVRSTALDSAEKVEQSYKIAKNTILGVVIAFAGVIIVQIVALLTGVEGSIFAFNLVPKQGIGNVGDITEYERQYGACLPEQTANGGLKCEKVDGRWRWR